MGMHNDQKYGKSFMTSHENSDQDNGAKMLRTYDPVPIFTKVRRRRRRRRSYD